MVFVLLTLLSSFILLQSCAYGVTNPSMKSIIIVSEYEGYSSYEMGKASSFYSHMRNNCSADDIIYLTNMSQMEADGNATVNNIENAFNWLKQNSTAETEVVIYIYDHAQCISNENYLIFNDGNISFNCINGWLNQTSYGKMTVILNGKQSGIGGPELKEGIRDIICSMGSFQEYNPDLFNITRSLEDSSADTNQDGQVSYIEAYWKEVGNLQEYDQDPCIWI